MSDILCFEPRPQILEEIMANSQDPTNRPPEAPSRKQTDERRAQARSNTVLSRIEDMTYAILRKHEKQSALGNPRSLPGWRSLWVERTRVRPFQFDVQVGDILRLNLLPLLHLVRKRTL